MNKTLRKWIVSLKRKPQNIPLVLLVICCMAYTFQLTAHSNTSMYISSNIVAFYVFIITLSSMLTIFSFSNVFAKRQKNKGLMMAVVYVLMALQIFLDYLYIDIINYETRIKPNPVPITTDIAKSGNWTIIHLALLAVTLVVIIAMPLYHKLLLKIDTTIEDPELEVLMTGDESLVEDTGEVV